jgi:hypothetical protein
MQRYWHARTSASGLPDPPRAARSQASQSGSADVLVGPSGETFPLLPRPMSEANPGYRDLDEIVRFFASGAPIHLAAHWIEGAATVPARDYSCVHAHEEFTEVNILLGEPGGLVYTVVLSVGDAPTLIEAPCAVVIPPGVSHSANVLHGRGWFVVLRLRAGADSGDLPLVT